ncbi:DUF397 domain-containing protein [Streptomyces caelestis]|uniref:DUF397 domain-containing protein n=1 Tax=Streptomyces caelestis TaxID=36816 RepID=UPI003702FF7B
MAARATPAWRSPLPTRTAIRDSKNPSHGMLSVPTGSFTLFIEALKAQHPWSDRGMWS